MDRKDEIILKQYEIIRGLTERSLKSERGLGGVGSDFWGAPQMEQVEKKQQAASPAPAKPEPAPEEEKPETIDELKSACTTRNYTTDNARQEIFNSTNTPVK